MTREEFQALLDERAQQEIEETRVVEIHGAIGTAYGAALMEKDALAADLEKTRKLLDQARDANALMYTQLHSASVGSKMEKTEEEKEVEFMETVKVDDLLKTPRRKMV